MRLQLKFPERLPHFRPLSLMALLLLALPVALVAQPPARGGGPMGPGGGPMGANLLQMLESPAARALAFADSLGLSAEQRETLTAMEQTWTETHGEQIASLRTRVEAMRAQGGQPRNQGATRGQRQGGQGRMQGGQPPLQGLMQEMAPLREARETMIRDLAQVLTAAQFQQFRAHLAAQRPGGARQQARITPPRGAVRGWVSRTEGRLRRLEVQGQWMQRQLRTQRGMPAQTRGRNLE